MAWYDPTSWFSEESQSDTASAPSPNASYPDPNTRLSPHYTLSQLSATGQALSLPNLPLDAGHISNLQYSAGVLEQLESSIGPFTIISGFRTAELQNKLTSQGEPTSSGKSFHEIGRGFDIYPTTMSLDEFFGRMLSDENVKNMFAEIAIKPTQNAIHLGINVPGDARSTKVLGLDDLGIYGKLSLDQITKYIEPFMASAEAATDYAAARLVSYNRTPLILGMVAAFGGVLYIALAKPARRANPRVRRKANKSGNLGHLSDKALSKYKHDLFVQAESYREAGEETAKQPGREQNKWLWKARRLHEKVKKVHQEQKRRKKA